ncbi:MAG: hypothetical protein V6Z86_05595 [Hyphomicrobiales bacterium]
MPVTTNVLLDELRQRYEAHRITGNTYTGHIFKQCIEHIERLDAQRRDAVDTCASLQENVRTLEALRREDADEFLRLRKGVEDLRNLLGTWAARAGSTKTPRGRTLNTIRRRLKGLLNG